MFRWKILKEKRVKKVLIYILIGKGTITHGGREDKIFKSDNLFVFDDDNDET